ncbi:MAG: Gfo/Idh/MocA family protein [Pirellulaceae bacterium]
MNENQGTGLNRREVIKKTGQAAMVTALAGVAIPHVHAAETGPIQVALVGCGGRGTGAAGDAMANKTSPVKLVAMADVFENRLAVSHKSLKSQFGEKVEVADDRRFLGFDGYKQAMDALRPGDVVILTTPPAFRWVHFKYAIDKGLNVFMEKPITVDGPSTRKMLALGEESVKKNLKVGVGLMCRHCPARQELFERIQNGEIGDLLLLRAYRVAGPTGSAFARAKPEDMTELMYQIKNFHAFLWASGGGYSDFLIHNIDESCWMKDAWPVEAKGFGGRHYRGEYVDQNFDTYTTEFTFADGSKLMLEGRCMPGCHQEFASYAHGSKGAAIISTSSHWPS